MISKLKVVVNGKEIEIPIELTSEQLNQICAASLDGKRFTGWEGPETNEKFYYIDALCRVQSGVLTEHSREQVELLLPQANCFTSGKVATDMARTYALLRNLRRIAATTRKSKIDFEKEGGYTITYNYNDKCLECGITGGWMAVGDILFDSEEAARNAINEYAEELIWYFTEMKDSL
jgi:hypothetical protein